MKMINFKSLTISVGTTVVALYLLNKHIDKYLATVYLKYKKEFGVDLIGINKMLTFEINNFCCPKMDRVNIYCTDLDCNYGKINHMLSFIDRAKTSVDICMYILTAPCVGDAIINAFRRGVKIRIITDAEKSFYKESQIDRFRKEEISVRRKISPYIMHHKFFVVDKEILVSGSMNFSVNGILCNWENVVITSQIPLVQNFAKEFQNIWDEMAPCYTFPEADQ